MTLKSNWRNIVLAQNSFVLSSLGLLMNFLLSLPPSHLHSFSHYLSCIRWIFFLHICAMEPVSVSLDLATLFFRILDDFVIFITFNL
jgi:hypothetical protein